MSIILDTSFLVASEINTEQYFDRAFELRQKIKNNEFGSAYISDYIFDEQITLMLSRSFRYEIIKKIGDAILQSTALSMINIDKTIFNKSWQLFNQYKTFSFTDCTTIALAELFNIRNIASFDTGFDRVKTIKRIF